MLNRIIRSRKMRAYGSIIDLLPSGDYSEHMPKGNRSELLETYWKSTGKYIGIAIEQHDKDTGHCRIEPNCQTA